MGNGCVVKVYYNRILYWMITVIFSMGKLASFMLYKRQKLSEKETYLKFGGRHD